MSLRDGIAEILIDERTLTDRVRELGRQITADYAKKSPVIICILKGASIFAADLLREIDLPVAIDFMAISSYGAGTRSTGIVRISKDLDISIEGRDVLVVEDIIDTGLTLYYLMENLRSRRPESVKVCVLLDKTERREVDMAVDYCGFQVPDKFLVGYGLDYAEKYRNLPFIGVLAPEIYS